MSVHTAARRLGLSVGEFREKLPELVDRGFPLPDRTTGYFDLIAIDRWQDRRNPHLFEAAQSLWRRDAREVVERRLAIL